MSKEATIIIIRNVLKLGGRVIIFYLLVFIYNLYCAKLNKYFMRSICSRQKVERERERKGLSVHPARGLSQSSSSPSSSRSANLLFTLAFLLAPESCDKKIEEMR